MLEAPDNADLAVQIGLQTRAELPFTDLIVVGEALLAGLHRKEVRRFAEGSGTCWSARSAQQADPAPASKTLWAFRR